MKKKIAALIGVCTVLILGSQLAWADIQTSEAATGLIGSWISILPPLVAIAIALIFKQVLFALFLGIWMGAFLIGNISFSGIFSSFFGSLSDYIVPGVSDPDRMSIVVFSILIGGMVGIITDNGGTRGVIKAITKFVRTKVQGMVVTSLMGFIVFFDDYANTMVVGNTMRPLTDKLRISRAKLAYLVDATAAPIATVALVSTWIGAMVGFIATAEAEMANFNEAAYSVFIHSLPYNFYAFFTILFVILIAFSGRDYGTMLKARITLYKAKHDPKIDKYNLYKEKIEEDEEKKSESHWTNAAIPILTLVIGTIAGLFVTGEGNSVQAIVETANSYNALLWGSIASVVVAIVMTLSQKLLDVEKTLEGMMNGMHVMFDGVLILVLAWALSDVTVALGTADYLISVFGETLNPYWMPALVFVLSALTAFATGSSWGTMGILMPLVVPLAWQIGNSTGIPYEVTLEVIYASVSAVLAGSVWGDHCSPISDTTILSSIATQCDHVEHVNTQLPYAMTVGVISIVAMISALVLNIPIWIIYPTGVIIIIGIIYKFGKIPDPKEYTPEGKVAAITSLD
ncbi:Na+/H+ antiporter NhaC family protein [Gracilimonas sp. Q87]|uniref:Na+/H+ antiporter NhaC family protein n=1 Tax=Gracilimonas sp. Q87 TaxID=3384766 RepID=UPI0039840107